jgi:hypothetical protein
MSVPSFTMKVHRALKHLDELKTEAAAWVKSKPYGIVDEPDPEPPPEPVGSGQPRRFRIDRVSDVPRTLSLTLGDCLFNLRAALDHLALALAQANTPTMAANAVGQSEFPIYSTKASYLKHKKRKIGCVSAAAEAAIEGLQPYHGGHNYAAHPLWQLQDLNRIDKHRSLTLCGAEPRRPDTGARGLYIPHDGFTNWDESFTYSQSAPRFAFELNPIWIRWAPNPIDANQEVRVQADLPVEIVFDQSGPAALEPVIQTTQTICDFVRQDVVAKISQLM